MNAWAWGIWRTVPIRKYKEAVAAAEPWTWLNNPPTVNQVLGLQWFVRLCYPDQFDDDMKETVTGYYKTFYNYDLSDAEYDELMTKAMPE